jgi:hypothetical protein
MTPEEAREIDRLEFEADCRAVRERVFARIAERHGAERARVLRWVGNERPRASTRPSWPYAPKSAAAKPAITGDVIQPIPPPPLPRSRFRPSLPRSVGTLSMTLREWADHLGITYNSLNQRIHKLGSLEAAVAEGGPKRRPGVVANFPEPVGTGGGPTTQDFTEIEFSQ